MNFVSIRIITADIKRLAGFYEQITGIPVTMYTEDFGELKTSACTLAMGSTRTLQLFGDEVARPAENHTAILEFPDSGADNDALGQPFAPVPRSGRQPGQLLYADQRGGDQEVRPATPAADGRRSNA